MSRIVRQVSRLVFPLVAIFSFYVIIHGHLTPGGGFQGGAIMASALAMVMVAYGVKEFRERIPPIPTLFAVFSFLLLLYFGSHFLHHPLLEMFPAEHSIGSNTGVLLSGGAIPLMSLAVGLEVMIGLTIIVVLIRGGSK